MTLARSNETPAEESPSESSKPNLKRLYLHDVLRDRFAAPDETDIERMIAPEVIDLIVHQPMKSHRWLLFSKAVASLGCSAGVLWMVSSMAHQAIGLSSIGLMIVGLTLSPYLYWRNQEEPNDSTFLTQITDPSSRYQMEILLELRADLRNGEFKYAFERPSGHDVNLPHNFFARKNSLNFLLPELGRRILVRGGDSYNLGKIVVLNYAPVTSDESTAELRRLRLLALGRRGPALFNMANDAVFQAVYRASTQNNISAIQNFDALRRLRAKLRTNTKNRQEPEANKNKADKKMQEADKMKKVPLRLDRAYGEISEEMGGIPSARTIEDIRLGKCKKFEESVKIPKSI